MFHSKLAFIVSILTREQILMNYREITTHYFTIIRLCDIIRLITYLLYIYLTIKKLLYIIKVVLIFCYLYNFTVLCFLL